MNWNVILMLIAGACAIAGLLLIQDPIKGRHHEVERDRFRKGGGHLR